MPDCYYTQAVSALSSYNVTFHDYGSKQDEISQFETIIKTLSQTSSVPMNSENGPLSYECFEQVTYLSTVSLTDTETKSLSESLEKFVALGSCLPIL